MPFLVPFIPAIIGGAAALGTAALSANAAGKANSNALAAQNTATQESLAAQQAALDRITQINQPFINAGSSVLGGLQSRVAAGAPNFSAPSYARPQGYRAPAATPAATLPAGMGTETAGGGPSTAKATGGVVDPASAGPPQPGAPAPGSNAIPATATGATPQATGPDWDAYIAQHPDVAQWIQQGHGDPSLGPNQTPEQAAQFQYENSIRLGTPFPAPPMLQDTQQQQDPNAPAPQPLDLGTASPVVADYTRPDQPGTPTFGASPDAASYLNGANFTTSPGYQFRMNEALRNTNASFGARGLLQSGSALKGFNDQIQNTASAEYNNWFNQQQQLYADKANQFNADRSSGLNQFNLDRNNLNNNFADDRSFGTNLAINNRDFANSQYNTQTQNMFTLAGIGANAAGAVAGAVNHNADNSTNLYNNQGNNAANAAYNQGSAQQQLYGTIGSTVNNLFSAIPRYSGGTSGNIGTASQPSYAGGY